MVVIFVIENYNIYFRGIYILLLRKKVMYVLVIVFVELFMEEFIIFSYKILKMFRWDFGFKRVGNENLEINVL